MDLNSATALLKGLVVFIQSLRTQFDIFEQRAKVTVHVSIITRVVEYHLEI